MFSKVLIANRGEIAIRIIRACRELGIKTVAVYSEADKNCLHLEFADEAICIGRPQSADSYLNISRLISAAEVTHGERKPVDWHLTSFQPQEGDTWLAYISDADDQFAHTALEQVVEGGLE